MRRLLCSLLLPVSIAAAASGAATSTPDRVPPGVSKPDVEIVLAQFEEDISWSDLYSDIRTVYCKGPSCKADTVELPNVGREGHTYLHHIVNHYDDLASWTVFSQAEKPTQGYYHHSAGGERGGHMPTGVEFADYLQHSPNEDSKFVMTSQLHLPSFRHSLRSSFQASELPSPGNNASVGGGSASTMCPSTAETAASLGDVWRPFQDVPQLVSFLSQKCGLEEHVLSSAALYFWEEYVQLPRPKGDIIHYAQGARFAVSRNRIHQRSREFYQRLLEAMSTDQDPCLGYLLEWVWYYVLGKPSGAPCESGALESLMEPTSSSRLLADGISGGISGNNDAPASISETVAVTVVSGSLGVDLPDGEDANSFCANEAVISGFQETLSDITSVPASDIDVECGAARRLVAGRQLATSVTISYSLTVDQDTSSVMSTTPVGVTAASVQTAISGTDTTSFTSTLTAKLTAAGVTVVPTVGSISATTAVVSTIVRTMTQTSSTQTSTTTTIPEVDWATIFSQAEASSQDVAIVGSLRVIIQDIDLCERSTVLQSIASYLASIASLASLLQVSTECSTTSMTTSDGSTMTSTVEYTMTVTSETEAETALMALFTLAGDTSVFEEAVGQYFQQAGYSAGDIVITWLEVADTASLTPVTTTTLAEEEEKQSDGAFTLQPIRSAVTVLSSAACLVGCLY